MAGSCGEELLFWHKHTLYLLLCYKCYRIYRISWVGRESQLLVLHRTPQQSPCVPESIFQMLLELRQARCCPGELAQCQHPLGEKPFPAMQTLPALTSSSHFLDSCHRSPEWGDLFLPLCCPSRGCCRPQWGLSSVSSPLGSTQPLLTWLPYRSFTIFCVSFGFFLMSFYFPSIVVPKTAPKLESHIKWNKKPGLIRQCIGASGWNLHMRPLWPLKLPFPAVTWSVGRLWEPWELSLVLWTLCSSL